MPSTDPETIRSYDEIAPDFLARWHHRPFMKEMIARFVALLPEDGAVLDVGCGPGFDAAALSAAGAPAVGLDLSWGMLSAGRNKYGGTFLQADMCRLPFSDRAMRGLWVNAALLHLPRAGVPGALREFRRILAPDGVVYLSVKQGQGEGWSDTAYERDAPRYFTYWQPAKLDEQLQAAGFAIVYQTVNERPEVTWLIRIVKRK